MAKKRRNINYRAQQNHKRNLEKTEARRKDAATRAFWKAHGLKIAIATAVAIVVILAVWLGCKFFVGPDGSLPNFFGNLRTVESDWIVSNTGTTRRPTYFKMGEMGAPEGYTLDPDFQATTDAMNQTFYYAADDENEPVKSIYVSGVANKKAEDMIGTVSGYGMYESMGEAKTATIAGHEVNYCYFVYGDSNTATDSDLDGEVEYSDGYPSLCMYINAAHDSSVLVLLNGKITALADVASEEVLMAKAEEVLPLLSVEK